MAYGSVFDSFFNRISQDNTVKQIDCTLGGEDIDPLRLDTFSFSKNEKGIWLIKLEAAGSYITRKVQSSENMTFRLFDDTFKKILTLDYRRGPDLRLLSRGDELTLQMSWKKDDIYQICSYKNF
jgi:hypothetical protein